MGVQGRLYMCISVTQLFIKALHSVSSKSHLENLISPLVHAAIVLPVRERLQKILLPEIIKHP